MVFSKLFGRSKKPSIGELSVQQAHELNKNDQIVLIDVRRPEEWQDTGRPQGSLGVTLQDPQFVEKVQSKLNDKKEAPVALSCRTGSRSMQAAQMLLEAQFTNVFNVMGGFVEWTNQNLPLDQAPFED